jgi:ribonuclease VapC
MEAVASRRFDDFDCFASAFARTTSEPLFFKDDDFSHTDITPALM